MLELEVGGGCNESGAEGVHLLELKDTRGCSFEEHRVSAGKF